jgi:dihydroorotate dehydrogenase electron transfer subunit
VRQIQATITEKILLAPAWWQLTLQVPPDWKLSPGQFLLVQTGGSYLRRVVFPRTTGPCQLSLTLRPTPDPGLAWLNARQVGETVDVIGLLGQPFPLPDNVHNLLLVGDEQGVTPLLGLADQAVTAGKAVTVILIGGPQVAVLPTGLLSPQVELLTITGDPRFQKAAPHIYEPLLWADLIFASGSVRMYQFFERQISATRPGSGTMFFYGIVSTAGFTCGLGACGSCIIKSATGSKLACVDGPVVDLINTEYHTDTVNIGRNDG